jgi:UDP-3-O-[3-hydroxymyristoyl] glucosamine N-acyltransferase
VVIGKNVVVCALCGISGSVKIGNNVVLAGAVGLADHIVIEDDVFIGPQAGVMEKLVKKGSKLLGTPAADYKAQMTFFAMRHKIKAMYDDLKRIKEKLGL